MFRFDTLETVALVMVALCLVGLVMCLVLWVRFHRFTRVDAGLSMIGDYHGYRPKSRTLMSDLVVVFDMDGAAKTYPVYRPGMTEAYAVVLEAVTGRPFRGPFAWGNK
jgi:hypothetical protein